LFKETLITSRRNRTGQGGFLGPWQRNLRRFPFAVGVPAERCGSPQPASNEVPGGVCHELIRLFTLLLRSEVQVIRGSFFKCLFWMWPQELKH
jgi:hypothetical protein